MFEDDFYQIYNGYVMICAIIIGLRGFDPFLVRFGLPGRGSPGHFHSKVGDLHSSFIFFTAYS
jgi:hypothetical protein